MISMINGKIRALELFGKEETFKKVYPKLLRSYIVDALAKSDTIREEDGVDEFLKDLEMAQLKAYNSLGKGKHLVIEGKLQRGMALTVEQGLVHIYTFKIG